jgi:leader peptidase (prepilin peptidase)/N-methyltransferase
VTWHLIPGLVAGVVGAAGGALTPRLIARVPEPEPEPEPEADVHAETGEPAATDRAATGDEQPAAVDGLVPASNEAEFARRVDEPKELYAEVAELPGLAWKCAVFGALALGVLGARIGFHPIMLVFVYLTPVCLALTVIDWRTRYLPTWLIAPSYFVVGGLCVLASLLTGDWPPLETAAIGWIASFGFYFLLNLIYPAGMAYGDVRLSGVLGMALGWVGVGPLVLGMYTGFVLGAIGGSVLARVKLFSSKHYPFGPFMVIGAWLGVAFPAQLGYAYGWVINLVVQAVLAVAGVFG